jgi:signal transduction histidine kinase/DNA-binding response OmpR family regulator/PAS domain-containing protein
MGLALWLVLGMLLLTSCQYQESSRSGWLPVVLCALLVLAVAAIVFLLQRIRKQSAPKQNLGSVTEASFAAFVRENPNISIMFDENLRIIEVNQAAIDILAFKDKRDMLDHFYKMLPGYILPTQAGGRPAIPITERLKTALKEGATRSETALNIKGRHVVLDMYYRRIPYQGSYAAVVYANDITNLRQEQEKLQKLADTVGVSGAYIWEIDVPTMSYKLVTDNVDWLGIKDRFREGPLEALLPQMVAPEDLSSLYGAFLPYARGNGEGTFSYVARFNNYKNGGVTWVRVLGYTSAFDAQGKVAKVTGSIVSIDEQMQEIAEKNASLERQRRLLFNVFSTMDAAVLLIPGAKPYANAKFYEVMPGWESEFTFAQDIEDLRDFFTRLTINPQDHLDSIKRLRETKESQETLWHFKNGTSYSIRGFIVDLDERAQDFAELWVLRDITERETQRVLFTSMFEGMDPAVVMLPNGEVLANNGYSALMPGWQQVYREAKGQITRGVHDLWNKHLLNADELLRSMQRLYDERVHEEKTWHFRDGREYLSKGFSVNLGNDTFAEMWMLRDITELEFTKQMFSEIFNVMDPAVVIMNDNRMIANNAYNAIFPRWQDIYYGARHLGSTANEFDMLHDYWDSMITNADEHFIAIRNLRDAHKDQQSIWHFRDGRECIQKGYWINVGNVGGELWVLTDVSDFMDAVRRANEASMAKSRFLSAMSHEIRTPMNAIIGMTALARKTHDIPRIQRYLEKTEEAGRRLMSLINDVLDMSKIESGKLQIAENEFDYIKMCENAVNVIAEKAMEKRIEVKTKYGARFSHLVLADELRVSQVIVNLLSNAVKFTPEGGQITLTTDVIDDKRLRITCQDNGIGIGEEAMPKLFASFEQADKSITRQFGGTGLGLAICKQIVELMGGSISVHSILGVGSIFSFEIPFEWRGPVQISLSIGDALENVRILVVDDEPAVTEYFAELLKSYYIDADIANDGFVALRLAAKSALSNSPYQIAFVDWRMPEMSGAEIAVKIRETLPHCQIVIISAYDWAEIKQSMESNADLQGVGFMPKPIPPSDIYNRIVSLLNIQVHYTNEADFSGKRLLLVEDVEVNRLIVTALLEDTGCVIDEAENGQIALGMAKQGDYDLILMDMQMPVMDGLTATRAIRKFDTVTPIIAMTANAFREDADACLAAGMNAHIAKPFDNDVFMRTLVEYIDKKRGG